MHIRVYVQNNVYLCLRMDVCACLCVTQKVHNLFVVDCSLTLVLVLTLSTGTDNEQ